jgi:hypothetical protein
MTERDSTNGDDVQAAWHATGRSGSPPASPKKSAAGIDGEPLISLIPTDTGRPQYILIGSTGFDTKGWGWIFYIGM